MPKPKILFFDVETSALRTRTWTEYLNGKVIKVDEDYQILTIAWHFEGEEEIKDGVVSPVIHCLGQDDFPDYVPGVNNDLSLLRYFWVVVNEADYEVSHNGDSFDMKKLRARMLIRGLPPYSPPIQYDTKKAAKRVGGFTSNRLGALAKDMGVAAKGDPGGFETWEGCERGEAWAWAHMKEYNIQDIPPMIGVYKKLAPWDKLAPSLSGISDKPTFCTFCLGDKVWSRGLTVPSKAGIRKERFQCGNLKCGKWMQGKKGIKTGVTMVSL